MSSSGAWWIVGTVAVASIAALAGREFEKAIQIALVAGVFTYYIYLNLK